MTQDPNQPPQPYTPPQGNPYAPYGMCDPTQFPAQHGGMYGMPMKHSGLGIASFVIGLLAGLGFLGIVIAMAAILASTGGQFDQKNPPANLIVLGGLMFVVLLLQAVGAVLGLVAVMQRGKKRVFGVLGLIFNGAILLLVLAGFVIQLVRR